MENLMVHLPGPSCKDTNDTSRGLVCARCWQNIFNTETYEKLFTGSEIIYNVAADKPTDPHSLSDFKVGSAAEIAESALAGCSLCAFLHGDLVPSSAKDIQVFINLTPCHFPFKPCTPAGKNVFRLLVQQRSHGESTSVRYLHAFTAADDKAAGYVTARPYQADLCGQSAKQQIEKWVRECKGHKYCGAVWQAVPLPKRVIEVSPQGNTTHPRLLESRGRSGTYATLSYCWGTQPFVTLKRSNHKEFEQIDMDTLPPTVRDAIAITRKLSIPYLWVDALCIEQDSEADKLDQIGRMGDIYASSAVTIVAARAKGAFEGFLHPSLPRVETIHATMPVRVGEVVFGTMSIGPANERTYDERLEPLAKRAWTMQEQLLAQCTLTFTTHTMIWRCNHGTRNAGDSLYLPHTRRDGVNVNFAEDTPNLYTLLPSPFCEHETDGLPRDRDQILDFWLQLVTAYSLRTCTVERDTLNAIASLASLPSFRTALGTYCAGLWEYNLERQLTWRRLPTSSTIRADGKPLRYRDGDFGAPSWSWASMEGGPVEFWSEHKTTATAAPNVHCEFTESLTMPTSTANPFGELRSAQLRLRGVLRKAWFKPYTCCSLFFLPVPTSPSKERGRVSDNEEGHIETWSLDEAVAQHHCERCVPTAGTGNLMARKDRRPRLYVSGLDDEVKPRDPVIVRCLPVIDSGGKMTTYGPMLPDGRVDGLMLVPTKDQDRNNTFRRIGVFMGAKKELFNNLEKIELTIV
jgi:hypothetical protein